MVLRDRIRNRSGFGPATNTNVYRLTQTGTTFHAIRTSDDALLPQEDSDHGHAPCGAS